MKSVLQWRANKLTGFCENPYFFPDTKLYPKQSEVLRSFWYGGPTKQGFQELDLLKGMRSGGSFLASMIALDDAADILIREDPARDYGFASHSTIHILACAKSEEQAADTIYKQIIDKIRQSPFFRNYRPRIRRYDTTFRRKPDLEILAVGAASAGSASGRNVKCVIFDEISKYDETKSQRGAWTVYSILSKSTQTFGFRGHRIALSSCLHNQDIITGLVERASHNPWALGLVIPTWDMNPNLPLDGPEMQNELKKDPQTFWRDFGCKPFATYDAYYHDLDIIKMDADRDNVLATLYNFWKSMYDPFTGECKGDIAKIDTQTPWRYVLTGDPAPKQDGFGLCLMHNEKVANIADGLLRLEPLSSQLEINPVVISNFLVWLVTVVPIRLFVTDIWNYPETLYRIQAKGCPVQQHTVTKADHDRVKEDFYMHRLALCHYPFINGEFENLMVVGGTKVDHIRGSSKDVVDALANARWAIDELRTRPQRPFNYAVAI